MIDSGEFPKRVVHPVDVSVRTVQRDWEKARLLLSAALRG